MNKTNRILILLSIFSCLLTYFLLCSIRSPLKNISYPLIYFQTAKTIQTEINNSQGHKLNRRPNADEIGIKRLVPNLSVFRRNHMTVFTDTSYYEVQNAVHLVESQHKKLAQIFPTIINSNGSSEDAILVVIKKSATYKKIVQKIAPNMLNALGFYHHDYNALFINQNASATGFSDQPNNVIRHEATHQWFYNQGLHFGFSIDRFWLVEGLAVYSEWGQIGKTIGTRLEHVKQSMKSNTNIPIKNLLKGATFGHSSENEKLKLGYDTSWAFVYYLMKMHNQAFMNYLIQVKRHPFQSYVKGDAKLLEKALGMDISELEKKFQAFVK